MVNPEGFLKYSNIYQGNTTDSDTLPDVIENLRGVTSQSAQKAIVVIDAGIATDANLKLLQAKGYDYVCISRSNLKEYQAADGYTPHLVAIRNKEELTLQRVSRRSLPEGKKCVKDPKRNLNEGAV